MVRIARVVASGYPHHIIQRGNRRQPVFFRDEDYSRYMTLLKEETRKSGVRIWGYCLMSNHVHIVAVPEKEESLRRAFGEAHRKYSNSINRREGWTGYLWQGRFQSYPLDERYLYAVIRYIENNPVKAGIVKRAEDYKWSSAGAHVQKKKDSLLEPLYLTEEITDWRQYLAGTDESGCEKEFEKCIRTGRPFGEENFIKKMEDITGRILMKRKPGPKPKKKN